ncbi:hypothetical protein LINPERHAP2_LOCUS6267 [Linum perenne]
MHEDSTPNPRCPRIRFSDDEIKDFYRPWSKALIVKVLECTFPYHALKRRLEVLWAKAGTIQVSDITNGFFLARFSSAEDYNRAAFEGPWKMFDYYITVAKWSPEFNEEEPIKKIMTWVRLPNLPIHFSILWRLEGLVITLAKLCGLIWPPKMDRRLVMPECALRLIFPALCLASMLLMTGYYVWNMKAWRTFVFSVVHTVTRWIVVLCWRRGPRHYPATYSREG